VFRTTRWTLVLRAQGDAPEAHAALGELCEAYWTPVFRFLRREGRDEDAARELTQEFFSRLLAGAGIQKADPVRGRFRSYLLGALKHFLADQKRHEGRLKRGGNVDVQSIDGNEASDTSPGLQVPDPSATVSDTWFDRQWALAIMDRSLHSVEVEFKSGGRERQFEVLKPWLMGDAEGLSQSDAATQLDLSAGAVKVAVHRLRKSFRAAVRAEIAQTVTEPDEVDAELRYLVQVLGSEP